MVSEWLKTVLSSAPLEIIDGDRGKNYPRQEDFATGGHCLFLNAGNVTSEGFNFSDNTFISAEKDAVLRKGKLHRLDIVLTTRGTVGNVAYYDNSIQYRNIRINSGMVIFRCDTKRIIPRFLYLFLRSSDFKNQVSSLISGSAQPQLPIRDINHIEVPLPPLPEQRAIAHILGTLDDKIELNRRMNETLEQMAQAIFKSWFVDFDPVRAEAEGRDTGLPKHIADLFPDRFQNSELWEIPEGWRVSRIGEELETILGGTPSRFEDAFWGGSIPWINSGKINEFRIVEPTEFITEEGLNSSATKLLPPRTTVIAITGTTLGQVSMTEIATCINQSIVGILGNKHLPSEFVYYWIKENIDRLIANQTGGAQQHINKNNVNEFPIIIPEQRVTDAYYKLVHPVFDQIKELCFESRTLAALRDALLPKLLLGEIRVKEAEKMVEEKIYD